MGYCTIADLVEAFTAKALIQLTDDAGVGTYDSDILNAEIANGAEEIDSYCLDRYGDSMPFATAPGILKSINVDIAIYRIHKRRGRITANILDAYEKAVKKLEGISKGLISLGIVGVVVTQDDDAVTFTDKTPEDRKFRDPEGY
jgi:phage gp36-like protein